jgi:hypothetical protein
MTTFLDTFRRLFHKSIRWGIVVFLIGFSFYSALVDSSQDQQSLEKMQENVSNYHSVSYKKAIKKSRDSAVRVISVDSDSGHVSTFSGTYVQSYGSYFIITVAHGLAGPCEFTKIVYAQELYDCVKLIDKNDTQDYAVIQVEEIPTRVPVKIPKDLPKNQQWRSVFTLQNKVIYTGYPNSIGPLSIGGNISGANGTSFIYLDSYAWEGSSGSGVFDSKGRFIGYVIAIDVGATEFGIQVLNNVVLVIPSFKIDWIKLITEAE